MTAEQLVDSLHVAVGPLNQTPEIATRPVADPETPIAVGVSSEAVVVAWVDEGSWTISRAWR